jgi:hypothetical protein
MPVATTTTKKKAMTHAGKIRKNQDGSDASTALVGS